MKLLVISDIHGSPVYLKKVLDIFERENYDKLILLGDELYHGPRNPIPEGYNPKEVIELLNSYKNKIIAVRGNCDTDLDQELLYFPIMSDYKKLNVDGYEFFITHGHLYNKYHLPPSDKKVILIHGHTHVPCIENTKEYMYLNPGSISDPRQGTPHTYMIYKEKEFIKKDLEGKEINSIKLDECY